MQAWVPKPLHLLLVEDQENDELLLLRELERLEYDVTHTRVETREAMASALADHAWDLIISDFLLPEFSAYDALALCHERRIDVPFIIVSGTIEEEEAVESMRLGAHDFITKGRLARLGPAIARGLRECAERQARRDAETSLRQAQKMETIGQLAGGVAHDFNNLLGVIQGYAELVRKELGADDPQRGRLDQILRAASRGAALTRQLLALSRQQPIVARPIDLNAVVTDMEALLRRLISEDIQITSILADGLHLVKADPVQIEQVLMNLAINARDAMDGGGRLVIETRNVELDDAYVLSHAEASPGRHAVLAVSDTGHGMDRDTLSRAFEPFFTTKERGKGTGLGLATVYGIVKQSGGHVAAESERGRGSTFKVYLPCTDEEEQGSQVASAGARSCSGSETVLVLEDEPALRAVVRELLEDAGYTVIDGQDSEMALKAAEQHGGPVHLIVTDVVMPGMTGVEAVARILASRPGIKVLYMSGYAGTAAEQHGALPSHHAFIPKPFSLDALLYKVREVLDSSQ